MIDDTRSNREVFYGRNNSRGRVSQQGNAAQSRRTRGATHEGFGFFAHSGRQCLQSYRAGGQERHAACSYTGLGNVRDDSHALCSGTSVGYLRY